MARDSTEERIEAAWRHVLLGECLVAQQELLVLQLKDRGHLDLAKQAESVLDNLTISLTLARADLSDLEKTSNRSYLDMLAQHYQHLMAQVA